MVSKIKEKYLPEDHEVKLHKQGQSLKKKDLYVATYIEEFQKLALRSRVQEAESVNVARYLNGLKWTIQEELSLFSLHILHCCF